MKSFFLRELEIVEKLILAISRGEMSQSKVEWETMTKYKEMNSHKLQEKGTRWHNKI